MTLGLVLSQLAWIWAVPPFGGSDEIDHAYRAAAVARGEFAPLPTDATRGTGAWVTVPGDLVEAARPVCESLRYTGPETCQGRAAADGMVQVATGAGRYNPAYYLLVGGPSRIFSGVHALYAMRLASSALCCLVFLLAWLSTARWANTNWPFIALTLSATPVVLYSSQIVAPNGVEIMAGLAFWTSSLGLLRAPTAPDRFLAVAAASSGVILATVRPLGPLWCTLIAVSVIVLSGSGKGLRRLLVNRRIQAATAAIAGAGILNVAWTTSMNSLVVGVDEAHVSIARRLLLALREMPTWVLQSIAAFPLRNDPAPTVVYLSYLVLGLGLLVIAYRAAGRRHRAALAFATITSGAVPFLVTLATVERYGTAWQGRYTLPYSCGVLLIAGLTCDQEAAPLARRMLLAAGGLFVVAHAVSPVNVLVVEKIDSPLSVSNQWLAPPPPLLGALITVAAVGLWASAVLGGPGPGRGKGPQRTGELA